MFPRHLTVITALNRTILIIDLLIGLLFLWGIIEQQLVEVQTTKVRVPGLERQLEIIFVSDIHFGVFVPKSRVRALVAKIKKEDPDMLFIGGDFGYRGIPDFEELFALLAEAAPPMGIHAVPGNHETPIVRSSLFTAARTHGLDILRNSGFRPLPGAPLYVAGTDDMISGDPDISAAFSPSREGDYRILMSHNPDLIEHIPPGTADLMISGHTHGGQITFFGLFAPFVPSRYGSRYLSGEYKVHGTTLLVSRGYGVIFPPFRFFARPQINRIILQKE